MKVGDLVKVNNELHLIIDINKERVVSFPEKGVMYYTLPRVITIHKLGSDVDEYTKLTKHKGKFHNLETFYREGLFITDDIIELTKV